MTKCTCLDLDTAITSHDANAAGGQWTLLLIFLFGKIFSSFSFKTKLLCILELVFQFTLNVTSTFEDALAVLRPVVFCSPALKLKLLIFIQPNSTEDIATDQRENSWTVNETQATFSCITNFNSATFGTLSFWQNKIKKKKKPFHFNSKTFWHSHPVKQRLSKLVWGGQGRVCEPRLDRPLLQTTKLCFRVKKFKKVQICKERQ